MNHRHNRVNVDPSPYLTTTDEGHRLKGKGMHISSSTNLQCNRLRAMKSTHAASALHQVRAVGQKPRGFSSRLRKKSPQPAPLLLSPPGQGEKIEEGSHLLCRVLVPLVNHSRLG